MNYRLAALAALALPLVALLVPTTARAQPQAQPIPPASAPIARIIAAVSINGHGPFRFMLDTGATQAVLTEAAARELGLQPVRGTSVHVRGINGDRLASEVHIDTLDTGALHFRDVDVPVLAGPVFEGLDGILGVQGLGDMELSVSFVQNRCVIEASPRRVDRRFSPGRPMRVLSQQLPMVQAQLAGMTVEAVIDTGASHTLGNPALLAALRRAGAVDMLYGAPPIVDATAAKQPGRVGITPPLQLGDVTLPSIPVTFADFEIFKTWGLMDRPALVLGMDALGALAEFSIDYGRLEMRVLARPAGSAKGARQASATAPEADLARG